MCIPGIVGKAERGHEQLKFHLSNMYIFYYHFIPPQCHLTSPMYISQGKSSGFPSSINLLSQKLSPGLGKAQPAGAEHPQLPPNPGKALWDAAR